MNWKKLIIRMPESWYDQIGKIAGDRNVASFVRAAISEKFRRAKVPHEKLGENRGRKKKE